jgi:ornithine carbamoyltransferase
MHISVKLGWNFTIANPEGYDLNPQAVEMAEELPVHPAASCASCAIRTKL